MRIRVARPASSGSAARYSSTARSRVVLPVPEEPISSRLPAGSPARCLARAIAASRTARAWPITRCSSVAAISRGTGTGDMSQL